GDHPFSATIRVIADEQAASLLSKGAQAAQGKDFRVLHSFNNSSFSDDKTNTFSIMATEDNTLVTVSGIHSGVVLKNMPTSGSPLTTTNFTVSLQAGESVVYAAYLNEPTATNNTNGTVGTKIHANKNVVVNSGSWLGGNALVGITSSGAYANGRDIGIDQMLPLERIGSEYVLVKGNGMDNERIVVVAEQ